MISSPGNAGAAAQTTDANSLAHSLERLGSELRSGSIAWGFQSVPRTSLSTSAELLFSVFAFWVGYFVVFPIIRKNHRLSSIHFLATGKSPQ